MPFNEDNFINSTDNSINDIDKKYDILFQLYCILSRSIGSWACLRLMPQKSLILRLYLTTIALSDIKVARSSTPPPPKHPIPLYPH
jgi:hypothetical protein